MDLPLRKSRLHLISRMENARAGNEAKSETLRQVSKEFKVNLWQMFKDHVERSTKTRNHWISWALSGTVRNVTKGEYFEIHNAQLSATKAEYRTITGRDAKDSGILLSKFSKGLRTKGGVAHFWERGVIVPWRPKWGNQFGQVKHPQGPIEDLSETEVDDIVTPEPSPPETSPVAIPAQKKGLARKTCKRFLKKMLPSMRVGQKNLKAFL